MAPKVTKKKTIKQAATGSHDIRALSQKQTKRNKLMDNKRTVCNERIVFNKSEYNQVIFIDD